MAAVDDQLDLERRRAPLATIGACIAAVLPMVGGIAVATTIRDQPKNTPGRLLYIHDHSGKFVLYSILLGLGALALVFPLRYHYDATKARKPTLPRVVDIFQTYLRELRATDLNGSAGLFRLKEEMTRRVKVAVAPNAVAAVLFKEIVVQ